MEELQAEIINVAVIALTAFIGWATKQVTTYLKKKGVVAQVQNNKEVVGIVVNAVEQMYKGLKGEEKLDLAKIELLKLMNQKKIKITDKELELMIESVVKEMKDSAKDVVKVKTIEVDPIIRKK